MELRRADEEKEQWKAIRRGWCFGSDEFRKEMLARTEGAKPETLSQEMRKEVRKPTVEKIVKEELNRLKWKEEDLKTRRKSDPEK
jgi:hypothetical protein